jgi:16S rRNA pseudouridine516 synthase
MKLFRALQTQGFGSRKACRLRVRTGTVAINGATCTDPDAEVDPAALELGVDGALWPYREHAYVALHKPAGYECSHQPSHHPSVFSLLPAPLVQRGVQCVGRLDQDTTGLLLLSDDGQFIHRLISPRKGVPKAYRARCAEPVTQAMCAALVDGVWLHGDSAPVRALDCEAVDAHTLKLTLAEGRYHQVKRMIAAAGNHVAALHRESVGAYALPADLPAGAWRWLETGDLETMERTWPFVKS